MSATSATTSATRKPLPSRHEAFCRHLADGCSQAEAANRAGYPPASSRQRGSELYARTEIQTRLGELMAERADEMTALRRRTLARLEVVHDKAIETDRLSLALRALVTIARIGGLDGVAVRQTQARFQSEPEPALDPAPAPAPAPARSGARASSGRKAGAKAAPALPPQLASALDAVLVPPSPRPPRAGVLGDLPLPGLTAPGAVPGHAAPGFGR